LFIDLTKHRKKARVHFIPDLKVGIFVTLCAPNVIKQIVANPTKIGKPKTANLKYTYGSHVADHFVIVYMIIEDNILFLYVDHYDFVYDEAPRILGNIEIEFPSCGL
jgi:mRNA-degrading endonuclease RelE of RelBE toxin-antitoxin system